MPRKHITESMMRKFLDKANQDDRRVILGRLRHITPILEGPPKVFTDDDCFKALSGYPELQDDFLVYRWRATPHDRFALDQASYAL